MGTFPLFHRFRPLRYRSFGFVFLKKHVLVADMGCFLFVLLDLELEIIIFHVGQWEFWIVLRIDTTTTRGVGSIGYCYILCEYILRDPKLKKFVAFLDGYGRSWSLGDLVPRRLVTVFLLVVLLLLVWCWNEMNVCFCKPVVPYSCSCTESYPSSH